jgi:hypothetical protein
MQKHLPDCFSYFSLHYDMNRKTNILNKGTVFGETTSEIIYIYLSRNIYILNYTNVIKKKKKKEVCFIHSALAR